MLMMSRTPLPLLVLGFMIVAGVGSLKSEPSRPEKSAVAPFVLKDPRNDKPVALGDYKDRKAIVLVFLGTECPINNAYLPVLAGLAKAYESKGVTFLGINANRQDTPDRIAAHAKKFDIPFPVLKDPNNGVADQLGAKRTPEAIVLDESRRIVYQGRIDDQFGIGYSRPG